MDYAEWDRYELLEEIERLRKEKEWLITQLCKDWDQDAHGTEKEDLRGFVIKQMQQALKKKDSEAILRNSLRNEGSNRG